MKDTIFYGKSGGQPGDIGEILADGQKIDVIETIKTGGDIKNILENINILSINQKITARINWDKRYKYMRMHSALHLMCASIPLGVTGGQIAYEKSRLDFNDPEKKINKDELQKKINELIIGSNNKGKIKEISDFLPKNYDLFSPYFFKTTMLSDTVQIFAARRELLTAFTAWPAPQGPK